MNTMDRDWDASGASDFTQKGTFPRVAFDAVNLSPFDGRELHRQYNSWKASARADVKPPYRSRID